MVKRIKISKMIKIGALKNSAEWQCDNFCPKSISRKKATQRIKCMCYQNHVRNALWYMYQPLLALFFLRPFQT